jgi:hypothetical protein
MSLSRASDGNRGEVQRAAGHFETSPGTGIGFTTCPKAQSGGSIEAGTSPYRIAAS